MAIGVSRDTSTRGKVSKGSGERSSEELLRGDPMMLSEVLSESTSGAVPGVDSSRGDDPRS